MIFSETSPPEDLSAWGLHAFSLGARSTPHGVVHMDHNGPLLYLAREGITKAQLAESGIVPSESQLTLLQVYGLIDIVDDVVTTRFPLLGPETMAALREATGDLAGSLAEELTDDVAAISTQVRQQGFTEHDYSVVFGYVIDGLFFDHLKTQNLVPSTELSIDHPFWNGVFWAIHPARDSTAGTNEVVYEKCALTAVWTKPTVNALMAYTASEEVRLLSENPQTQRILPVIVASGDDPIHRRAVSMSNLMTDALASKSAKTLYSLLEGIEQQAATVIICHELIWDVMEELTERELVSRPASFDTENPSREELSRQCFLVQSGSS